MHEPFGIEASIALEKLAGIKLAGAAVGLQDHQRMLARSAERVDQANRQMARAIGMEDTVLENKSDEVGNIIITGDIYGADARTPFPTKPEPPKTPTPITPPTPGTDTAQPQPTQPTQPPKPNWLNTAIIAASILGGSGLGAWIISNAMPSNTKSPGYDIESSVLPGFGEVKKHESTK